MARHNDLGRHGEDQVACYLRERGFVILERNWRTGRLELDFVCMDGGVVVVVEVKTRSASEERPEELLDWRKRRNLLAAGAAFLPAFPGFRARGGADPRVPALSGNREKLRKFGLPAPQSEA